MAIVTVVCGSTQKQCTVQEGSRLDEALHTLQAAPAMPCGGNHTCGKCHVRVNGMISEPDAAEKKFLQQSELENGIRLACFVTVLGDCTVYQQEDAVQTLSWARLPAFETDLGGKGMAIDVGTTTIAARLYDCADGTILGEALEANRQAPYGADVITRIDAAGNGHRADLHNSVLTQLTEMTHDCMKQAGISSVDRAVVTGNTTMLHFYEDLDASGIAVVPFTPTSLFGINSAYPVCGAPTHLPHCIGSYVGADIVCAILASGMMSHSEEISLLADLGTNGEIALYQDGKLYCCSTAAGPAFEGAGLHQGMRAANGAITAVALKEDEEVEVSVLGDGEAVGICGSGILDALRVMLELEIMDETGMIDDEYEGVGEITEWDDQPAWKLPGTEVLITQKDIRQIQLAKSAICAGIRTLLDHVGVEPEEVDAFYVAGGFGHSMNPQSAAAIGLFPPELLDAVQVIGNGALGGASMLLMSSEAQKQAEEIIAVSEELALSASPEFMDFYVDGMLFGEEE